MDMSGERRIAAPREKVWAALNDPEVLRASIPGCESLEKTEDNAFKATASVKIGPIGARFTGRVTLSDIDPPNGYRIDGEGQGGVAGFAKGGAAVRLAEDAAITVLSYDVKAQVGGKIAQLGARLIDASAKSMADQFFDRFAAQVAEPAAEPVAEPIAQPVAAAAAGPRATATSTPLDAVGPVEVGADGTFGFAAELIDVVEHAVTVPASKVPPRPGGVYAPAGPARVSILALIPTEIAGFPLIAWIGAAVCFVILVAIFGTYL